MSIYQRLVDLDRVFAQLPQPPIIVNDISTSTIEEKIELCRKIYTMYHGSTAESVASCECGSVRGNFNIGVLCHKCNTRVESALYENIDSILWVRAPNGVKALINPHIWRIINDAFTKAGFSLVRYICDTTYNPARPVKEIDQLHSSGVQRGYNYFIENFDFCLQELSNLKFFQKDNKGERAKEVLAVIEHWRDRVFCQYLPLPNKLLFVIEDTNVGKYVDKIYLQAINAIQTIASIDTVRSDKLESGKKMISSISDLFTVQASNAENETSESLAVRRNENRTVKMMAELSDFYMKYYKKNLGTKEGIIRKHLLSSRSHFSARCVITSLTQPHAYDEIRIPWPTATAMLRYHILNKLEKRGMTGNDAIAFITSHTRKYHPLLDEIFKELINEAVYVNPDTGETIIGVPVESTRNPSLTTLH